MKTIKNFSRVAEREYAITTSDINLLYYELPQFFQDEYHTYNQPRLCTILNGAKEVSVNQSQSFQYQKDEFVLLPPDSSVHMSMPKSTQALVYEFSDRIIDGVLQQVSDSLESNAISTLNYKQFECSKVSNRMGALHHRTLDILNDNNENIPFLLNLNSQEMVYELVKQQGCFEIIRNHGHHPISRAMRMMNSDLGKVMSVSDVAEEVGMSLSNFSQRFKAMTDKTPKAYLKDLKLEQAKLLLGNASVTDTAMEVGYDNISHFIRLFKAEFGLTPKQYQQHHCRTANLH
ncbi:AraC family transcriptional regulator [Vibrio sp. 10N.261.55.A7]|uniref:AraC family transcriptional regulator n=1 Tax=Vibrio sp. 10N.261.55.A7 TaxID=1880851 RepID=UPI000C850510|nr:AraC family transcriptional regulator [Vibrio sp. 10N.261.55.A7]PMJ88289.1 AraC family transcriptional regulator [Vibrio sp. 10N.261.55.A7]